MSGKWRELVAAAYDTAEKSNDPRTHVGAIVIGEYGSVARANEILDGCEKPWGVIHAERNALYSLSKVGRPHTLIVNWGCCDQCALSVVRMGVRKVVRHGDAMTAMHGDWGKHTRHGDQILAAGGVKVVEVVGELGVKWMVDGELRSM
jgi:deoxycytidylate deaminase